MREGVVRLFAEERHEKIIELLQFQNRVTVQELVEHLNVSEATIRRDLQELEVEGILKRTHGGAILTLPTNAEPTFNEKEIALLDEKKQIAKLAAEFVQEGDVIILDSGTTTIQMIPFICNKNITVVTNSIVVGFLLGAYENNKLILIGGEHRNITRSIVGSAANEMLQTLHVQKAFMGTNGIDFKFGATTPNVEEARTKNAMICAADELFLLADHTKFKNVTLAQFAPLSEINYLVTDDKTPSTTLSKYKKEGIKVIQNEVRDR